MVLSYKYNDIFVPVRGKECSTEQMPFISEKMPTYNEFANASLVDIYGEKIQTAYQREANQFNSVVLLNKGEGKFDTVTLDNLVQSMPILDAVSKDINKDGFEDLIVVGNIYDTEVETPRLDNPYGLILLSNGQNGYETIPPSVSGLYIKGDAKSVELVSQNNKDIILVSCNNGAVESFELKL